tara:strand:+ start:22735 stop:23877 length:1143 start_codon:yes stop_codon:yes gene_type:complete
MTRLITEEDINENLEVMEIISAIERMFVGFGEGMAATNTREDILSPQSSPDESGNTMSHLLKTMGGVIPALEVGAVRINSNILKWETRGGKRTKSKIPGETGKYTGLVLLFSTKTGELLAIFPDGIIQTYRVAVTSAIAAKYLANKDSSQIGILGAGPQARAHLLAFEDIFKIENVKVYSPTVKSRTSFVSSMGKESSVDIVSVDAPEKAFDQSNIIQCATNSLDPVFEIEWIPKGAHIGVLNRKEPPVEFFKKGTFDVFAQSWPKTKIYEEIGTVVREREMPVKNINYYVVGDESQIPEFSTSSDQNRGQVNWSKIPSLHEVISGEVKRENKEQKTAFYNRGFGTQFAAAGWALYQLAEKEDIGHVLPTRWFEQELQGT